MGAACCGHNDHLPPTGPNTAYRRVLWAVLAINALMFAIEIGAGLQAGSTSLQADALDFLGDAVNYGMSLFVVGMALRYRASAALAKGVSMGLFGLWILAIATWHTFSGTKTRCRGNGRGRHCRLDRQCCFICIVVGIPWRRRQHAVSLDLHPQ